MKFSVKFFDELTTNELYKLLQLRESIFIVEQNCIYQDIDDKDQKCYHLMAYENDALVALTRLVPPKVSYEGYPSIGRVATHSEYRGKGYGRLIMEKSLEECERLFPGYNIKISAQSYLIPFYESLQFEKWGTEYLEDGLPHQAMIRHSLQFGLH
jgi:ElaA protein